MKMNDCGWPTHPEVIYTFCPSFRYRSKVDLSGVAAKPPAKAAGVGRQHGGWTESARAVNVATVGLQLPRYTSR